MDNEPILCQEVTVLLIAVIIGTGVLRLPSLLADAAGPDGVLAFLLALGVGLAGVVLVTLLAVRYPKQSFAVYCPMLIGRFLGFVVNILFTVYLLSATALVLRSFSDSVNVLLLLRTPLEVTIITMLLAISLLARNGLAPIARASQILVLLFSAPLFIIPFIIPIFDLTAFLPLLQSSPQQFLQGVLVSIFSLAGYEVLLVFAPRVRTKKNLIATSLVGVLIAGLFSLLIIVISFGTLTITQVAKMNEPIFEVVKYMPVPVLLLERIDLFFFAIWITAVYSTLVILLYATSEHLCASLGQNQRKVFVWPLCALLYFLTRIPPNQPSVEKYIDVFNYSWLVLIYGIVPVLLLVSVIRQKGSTTTKRAHKHT